MHVKRVVLAFVCASMMAVSSIAETGKKAEVFKYQGIDVSHHQGKVDWAAVKGAGIAFAFAKATQGKSDVDPQFKANWEGMKKAALVRGTYHFFDPKVDAATQAQHFIDTVKLEPGDLPPVIDIEVAEGVSPDQIEKGLRVWLKKVAQAYGVQPIIYSNHPFIKANLSDGFGAYPLWLSDYRQTAPEAPGGWKTWTFWQYSQNGTIAGIKGPVDRDVYHGTEADLQQLVMPQR